MIPQKWHFWTWIFAAEVVYFLHRCSFAVTETTIQLFIYWHETQQFLYHNVSTPWHASPFNYSFIDIEKASSYMIESNAQELDYLHSEVARKSARYFMYYKLLLTIPAFLIGLFFGFWFERRSHAFQIIVPTLTWILLNMTLFLAAIVQAEQPIPYILAGAAISGLSGENVLQRAALFSYVGETTTSEERTTRFTRLTSALYFGLFTGSLLVGLTLFLNATAFFLAFFCGALASFGAVFVAIHHLHPLPNKTDDSQKQSRIVGWNNLISSIKVYIRPRENNGRFQLLLMLCAFFLNRLCYMGEEYVTFLYVQGGPLDWHRSTLGFYMAVRKLGFGIGLLFFLSTFFDFGRILLIAFSSQTWMMFLAAACTTVTGLSLPVDADEIRRYSGLISAVEVLGNIVGSVIFPTVFTYGLDIGALPGFIFLVEAGLSFAGLITGIVALADIQRFGGLENIKITRESADADDSSQLKSANEMPERSYDATANLPKSDYKAISKTPPTTTPIYQPWAPTPQPASEAHVPDAVLEQSYGLGRNVQYSY